MTDDQLPDLLVVYARGTDQGVLNADVKKLRAALRARRDLPFSGTATVTPDYQDRTIKVYDVFNAQEAMAFLERETRGNFVKEIVRPDSRTRELNDRLEAASREQKRLESIIEGKDLLLSTNRRELLQAQEALRTAEGLAALYESEMADLDAKHTIDAAKTAIPSLRNQLDGYVVAYLRDVVTPRITAQLDTIDQSMRKRGVKFDELLNIIRYPKLAKHPEYIENKEVYQKAEAAVKEASESDGMIVASARALALTQKFQQLRALYDGNTSKALSEYVNSAQKVELEAIILSDAQDGKDYVAVHLPIAAQEGVLPIVDAFVDMLRLGIESHLGNVNSVKAKVERRSAHGMIQLYVPVQENADGSDAVLADVYSGVLKARAALEPFMTLGIIWPQARPKAAKASEQESDEASSIDDRVAQMTSYTPSDVSQTQGQITKPNEKQIYFSAPKAAEALGVSGSRLIALLDQGKVHGLPSLKEGGVRRQWKVSQEEIQWIIANTPRDPSGRFDWEKQSARPEGYVAPDYLSQSHRGG